MLYIGVGTTEIERIAGIRQLIIANLALALALVLGNALVSTALMTGILVLTGISWTPISPHQNAGLQERPLS